MSAPLQQLLEANRNVLRQVNNEIALYAGDFAHHFLAGCFPAMMYAERAAETAEPTQFDADTEPALLETRRMHAYHWRYFNTALINGELLARRYTKEMEYEFVLVLDISRSLTADWFSAVIHGQWRENVCYRLKYLACALLNAAIRQDFACRVLFTDQDRIVTLTGRDDESLPHAVLEQMDELTATRPDPPEYLWPLENILRQLTEWPMHLVVAVLSDFLDPVQAHSGDEESMLSALSFLHTNQRLIVLQVNRPRDLSESRLHPESLYELTGGEETDRRKFSIPETAARRSAQCRWLGHTDGGAGQLETYLAMQNIPYQKFFKSDDMNTRLEELAGAILHA